MVQPQEGDGAAVGRRSDCLQEIQLIIAEFWVGGLGGSSNLCIQGPHRMGACSTLEVS